MDEVKRYQKLKPPTDEGETVNESNKRNLRSNKKDELEDELLKDEPPLTDKKDL